MLPPCGSQDAWIENQIPNFGKANVFFFVLTKKIPYLLALLWSKVDELFFVLFCFLTGSTWKRCFVSYMWLHLEIKAACPNQSLYSSTITVFFFFPISSFGQWKRLPPYFYLASSFVVKTKFLSHVSWTTLSQSYCCLSCESLGLIDSPTSINLFSHVINYGCLVLFH